MKLISKTINLREEKYKTLQKAHKILGKKKQVNTEIAIDSLYKEIKEKGEYYMKHSMAINMIQILIEDIEMENRIRNQLEKLIDLMEKEFDYLYENANKKVKDEMKNKTRGEKNKDIE